MTDQIELLAPAGNLDKLKLAIAYGADAVYGGVSSFSLRMRSGKELSYPKVWKYLYAKAIEWNG